MLDCEPGLLVIHWKQIEAVKQAVISGLGISMLPHVNVEKKLEEQKLTGIPHDVGYRFGMYMLHHTDNWLSSGVREFMEHA